MKTLLKILNAFFVFLGVIFFIIIIVGIIFIITDPLNLKPLFNKVDIPTAVKSSLSDSPTYAGTVDKNPALTADQEKTLEALGIDPATLPTTVTPEMEACAVQKLGQQRVDQLKQGATPTVIEVTKLTSCL